MKATDPVPAQQPAPPGPARYAFAFDAPPDLPPDELRRLLGGKGAGLVEMAGPLGLPVPAGFTITTRACAAYLGGRWPAGLDDQVREQVERLGETVGRRFGDAADPLLVSVRSGAPVSMPGMMDTLLNLGLTEVGAAGLARATGDDAFAADCLRRLRAGYAAVIGGAAPDDPWQQLRAAIEAIFRSWNSQRAVAYRRREGIPDDLGTAVTVQAMVFGNRGSDSATGVAFTRNPATGAPGLYGDVIFKAQGEDVVAGGQRTEPLAVLGQRLPDVAAELDRHAAALEHHYADLCDIEFTVEERRLWLLQVRAGKRSPRAALRMAIEMAREAQFPLSPEQAVRRVAALLADPPREFSPSAGWPAPIAHGLPASPGVASGAVASSPEAAVAAADRGVSVILVRAETSPEDVPGMARSAGVLTARGGLTSHAAVVARGWGIPAVVGAEAVTSLGLADGQLVTIDGGTGAVYRGVVEGRWDVVPEATTLLGWARELGIEVTAPSAGADPAAVPSATGALQLSAGDIVRTLAIKGSATTEQLADSLGAPPDVVQPLLDAALAEGQVELSAGQLRTTARGKLVAGELIGADRALLGERECVALLEAFHAFDGRMKSIVTAWQVREVGTEQVLNDHADAEYDAAVLSDLATLHADAAHWLAALAGGLPRFAAYGARLARALELATGGDQRFVASPRVDSYHAVWFELHEDLIRLAGRKRAE